MEHNREAVSAFSNEGRNAYVVNRIISAVLKLLRNRQLTEISISEITHEAGVGRTSFYRNFGSKEDVVVRKIKQLQAGWIEEYEASEKKSNAELYMSMFRHMREHREFYLLLQERNLAHLLLDILLDHLQLSPDDPNAWAYTKAFIAYGTYGWISEWMARGMQESPEELARLLSEHEFA